jgi:hypothetical protein
MQATMHSITRHRLGANTHVHEEAHEPQPDRSDLGTGSTPFERFEAFADKMLNFLASKRPPKTLDEVDSLLDELVRTRLNDRLTKAELSMKPGQNADGRAASQHAAGHEGSNSDGPAHANQAVEASSHERLLNVGGAPTGNSPENGSDKTPCGCTFCNLQKRTGHVIVPLSDHGKQLFEQQLDTEADRTLAVLAAAQANHFNENKRIPDPNAWLDWYGQLFAAIITISTLGAGFTFGILFSGIQVPVSVTNQYTNATTEQEIREKTQAETDEVAYIRNCLAISWTLFVFAIGTASFVALIVNTLRDVLISQVRQAGSMRLCRNTGMHLWGMVISTLLAQLLPVGAFMASAEAVRQYNSNIGLAAWVGTGLAGMLVIFSWCWQYL